MIPSLDMENKEEGDDQESFELESLLTGMVNDTISKLKDSLSFVGDLDKQGQDMLNRVETKKSWINEVMTTKRYNALDYIYSDLPYIIPIACSTVVPFHHPLMMLKDNPWPMEIAITVFPEPEKRRTKILLAGNINDIRIYGFFNMLRQSGALNIEKTVSDLLLHKGYNIYISPRLYERLNAQEKEMLIKYREEADSTDIGLPKIDLNLFDQKFKDKEE
jgi:hypothetical protein